MKKITILVRTTFFIFAFSLFADIVDLSLYEKKVFSQNGEDGVLEEIFHRIGTTNKFYVEFGTESGAECNTRFLREKYGWMGLMMDGKYENHAINLQREFITAENINFLFVKYSIPLDLDLLSIDIDFNDWHIWHAISPVFRPRVVVIEYNSTPLPDEDKVVPYDSEGQWDGSNYFGASILAMYNLGVSKGYSLVFANNNGVNLFFIRNDIIEKCKKEGIEFLHSNDVEALYRKPAYGFGPDGGHPQDLFFRTYTDSLSLLKSS